jgi:NAD(P)-dependent dehydrogenase (short-subunit alcohol dehydrogenase family)
VLLEGKNAAVYGAGGSTGGAVSRAFARGGATVHLAGRTQASLVNLITFGDVQGTPLVEMPVNPGSMTETALNITCGTEVD